MLGGQPRSSFGIPFRNALEQLNVLGNMFGYRRKFLQHKIDFSGSAGGKYRLQAHGAPGGSQSDRSDPTGLEQTGERSLARLFRRRHHRCDGNNVLTVLIRQAAHARLRRPAASATGIGRRFRSLSQSRLPQTQIAASPHFRCCSGYSRPANRTVARFSRTAGHNRGKDIQRLA